MNQNCNFLEANSIQEIKEKHPSKKIKITLNTFFCYYLNALQNHEFNKEYDNEKVEKLMKEDYEKTHKVLTYNDHRKLYMYRTMISPIYLYFYTKDHVKTDPKKYDEIFFAELKKFYDEELEDYLQEKKFKNDKEKEEELETLKKYNKSRNKYIKVIIEKVEGKDSMIFDLGGLLLISKLKHLYDELKKNSKEAEEKVKLIFAILEIDYKSYCECIQEESEILEIIV